MRIMSTPVPAAASNSTAHPDTKNELPTVAFAAGASIQLSACRSGTVTRTCCSTLNAPVTVERP